MKVEEVAPPVLPRPPVDKVRFTFTYTREAEINRFTGSDPEDFKGGDTKSFAKWLQKTALACDESIEGLVHSWDMMEYDDLGFELDVEVIPQGQVQTV